MPTAIIADDEDLQRMDLRRLLAQAWPELSIVAECEDGGDALEAIARFQPDCAFLDIRMPDLSGLDVARASHGQCHIIFTTAYDSHAIEAFNLGAQDYLLKPILPERLAQAVERLKARLASPAPADLLRLMSELDQRLRPQDKTERIRWINASSGNVIHMMAVDEVLFFESDTRYTRVVTATQEGLIRTTIKELQKGLDPEQFWQIHRGTLVNAHAIARARRDEIGNLVLELKNHPEPLKVSQSYAWRFKGM